MNFDFEPTRSAFEEWLASRSFFENARMHFRRTGNGPYLDFRVNDRWNAWCAALKYERKSS